MIVTNSRHQINELIDREATIRSSARGRTVRALGVVLRAARKATGAAAVSISSGSPLFPVRVEEESSPAPRRQSRNKTRMNIQALIFIDVAKKATSDLVTASLLVT